ncbi:MAG: hypothetical protein RSJ41_04990 [Clostridia bacterium]
MKKMKMGRAGRRNWALSTLAHLATKPSSWLIASGLLGAAGLLCALVNLGWGDPGFFVQVQYLSLLAIPLCPLLARGAFAQKDAARSLAIGEGEETARMICGTTMGADADEDAGAAGANGDAARMSGDAIGADGAGKDAGESAARANGAAANAGVALGYLAFGALLCAPLCAYPALIAPSGAAFGCVLGFFAFFEVMLAICLVIEARVGRHALGWSLAAMVALRALTGLAQLPGRAGALVGWVGVRFSPYALLTPCVNGLVDVRALACALIACALCVALVAHGRGGARKRDGFAAVLAAFCVALCFLLPTTLSVFDLNAQQPTLLSSDMALSLKGLNAKVLIRQVAQVGNEDVWVRGYLQKLAERHAYIAYRAVDPRMDARIAELKLPDNSLIVENEDQWIVVRQEAIYQSGVSFLGTQHTFDLEGALLTAISEATGLKLTYGGVPRGRPMNVVPLAPDEAGKARALALIWGAPGACLAAAGLAWARKRRGARR